LRFLVLLLVAVSLNQSVIGLSTNNCCADMPQIISDIQAKEDKLQAEVDDLTKKYNSLVSQVANIPKFGAGQCPAGFTYSSDVRTCYNLVISPKSWADAAATCKSLGGDLVRITTQDQNNAVINYIKFRGTDATTGCAGGAWTAGHRRDDNCSNPFVWKTSSGAEIPAPYAFWHGGQPDCFQGREKCINVFTLPSGDYNIGAGWNDYACDTTLLCPLCQI